MRTGALAIFALLWPATATAAAGERGFASTLSTDLAHHFAVGEQRIYDVSHTATTRGSKAGGGSAERWRVTCLSVQDKQYQLLLDAVRVTPEGVVPGSARGLILEIDRFGRREIPEPVGQDAPQLARMFDLLPVLPGPLQAADAWETAPDLLGRTRTWAGAGPDPQQDGATRLAYTEALPFQLHDVLGRHTHGRVWLDSANRIVRAQRTFAQEHPAHRVVSTVTLQQRTRHSPRWADRRKREADLWLQTLRYERRCMNEAVRQPTSADEMRGSIRRLWQGRRADFTDKSGSPFAALAAARIHRLDDDLQELQQLAAYAQRWLGRAAAPWSLQQPDGSTATSEELRRNGALEYLWTSESATACAVLPSLEDAAAKLMQTPIRVVGLNLDDNMQLAAALSRQLPQHLTHVLAGPLREVEQPRSLPVVRVVDRAGVIRRIWIGWRPDYDQAVEEARRLTD